MPQLREMTAAGQIVNLVPSFPCVTCPVQANMTTGRLPAVHGVVGNGIYWREKGQIEMWTAPNDCVQRPQIWDLLSHVEGAVTSAVWFAMHSVGCEADYVCTPKPIHNPDGSESLWCYTRPVELYGELRDALGHFPLQHFWGPLANIRSTTWIAQSAAIAARRWAPDFFWIYLPHLDYAAQKLGPDSPAAATALGELDAELGRLHAAMQETYGDALLWLVAGEYAISPVDHVAYPNRVLREAGLLRVHSKPTANTSTSPPAAPGPWPTTSSRTSSRLKATLRRLSRLPISSASSRASPKCCWATTRPLRAGPSPQRRSHSHFRSQQLASLLLLALRRQGPCLRSHRRYPSQTGL